MQLYKRYIELQSENSPINIELPKTEATLFIVIPCYNEPDIISTINSLSECYPPKSKTALLIVVNSSEDSPQNVLNQNLKTISDIKQWKIENPDTYLNIFHLHTPNLPRKFAGVGLARKIGIDEAIRQLYRNSQDEGIIVSLDADCTVSANYLRAIESSFEKYRESNFFTINFSHQIDSVNLSDSEREGIIRYELHMRYFRNALEWCGYPHSIHTVGSSFTVRASAYVKQGGMNRRMAGEDFYFLHKLVLLGPYGNINSTTVFPAARQSDRVPFGTGAAMKKWVEGKPDLLTTYSFDSFLTLKPFFENPSHFLSLKEKEIDELFNNYPDALKSYLKESEALKFIIELQANCSNSYTFVKRFFHRINAFWILKYLNFVHGNYFKRGELYHETLRLLLEMGIGIPEQTPPIEILKIFRDLDRKSN